MSKTTFEKQRVTTLGREIILEYIQDIKKYVHQRSASGRTEIAITAPATPMLSSRIIKIMDGNSLSSTSVAAAALVAFVSRFMEPTGAGAGADGEGAGAALPPCNQDGVSDILFASSGVGL
jgi:hypothetical protein